MCVYTCAITINEKEAIKLQESKEGCVRDFEGRAGRKEM